MTFITALESQMNDTVTLNGAKSNKSTLNKCLDLFGKIGACRNDIKQAQRLFAFAYAENPETATRILFWVRDIRGGGGEREVFRNLFKYLVEENGEIGAKLVSLVPAYGRWDDLLVLENTSAWDTVLELIKTQLLQDVTVLANQLPNSDKYNKEDKSLLNGIIQKLKD